MFALPRLTSSDQILQAAERKQSGAGPASTAPSPAISRGAAPPPGRGYAAGPVPNGRGIASTGPGIASSVPQQGYRAPPPQHMQQVRPQMPPPQQGGWNPNMQGGPVIPQRGTPMHQQRPPAQTAGRRF